MIETSADDIVEQRIRSIAKALSWRILASTATGLIAYAFTVDRLISMSIAVTDFIVKILLYYIHERIWSKIRWGYKTEKTLRG